MSGKTGIISLMNALIFLFSFIFSVSLVSASDFCYDWQNNLYYGLRENNDVRFLQTALNKEGLLAEDYITGNFFNLTFNSVKSFQKKYGIEQTGFVGPLTRGQLNKIYACGSTAAATSAPISKTAAPKITEVIPSSGQIGATIILKGTGFSTSTNRLYVGYDVLENIKSENGEIKFVFSPPIPKDMKSLSMSLTFGFYVENINGLSNAKTFLLTF
ncbi:MAG: peptidoglycan-binding domain-containing protein [Candidatus Paceibacterota bacterium]